MVDFYIVDFLGTFFRVSREKPCQWGTFFSVDLVVKKKMVN